MSEPFDMNADASDGRAESQLPPLAPQRMTVSPVSVRIVDRAASIVQVSALASSAHAAPPPSTLRELWECDQPRDPDTGAAISYLDSPGVRALSGEEVRSQRLLVERDDDRGGARVVHVSATPLTDVAGHRTGVMLLETDAAVRVVPALAPVPAALTTSPTTDESDRRLAAIAQLASGMIHDLNNALNPIVAAAFLLRHHADSPDKVREYADRISAASDEAVVTASRVGRFVRQQPVHAGGDESIDLSALASDMLDGAESTWQRDRAAGRAVRVVREVGDAVRTRGLPSELRAAVQSLLGNALDAMPGGGILTVRTFTGQREACLSVQDSGVGMSAEVRARAFEPFFTTKGAGGLGLGLSEVYGILRRHRGVVTLESARGDGTTVTLRLPRETVEAVAYVSLPVKSGLGPAPIRVLVVEDHEEGRRLLRRILESAGHRVDAVGTCAEARERLTARGDAAYDLLLTDIGLPDGSGWDVTTFAQTRMPGIRVGVITGWEVQSSADDAVGAEFVLQKPLRAKELLAHIAGRSSPAQPE